MSDARWAVGDGWKASAEPNAEPADPAPGDGGARGLFALWAAIGGGWFGLFTPFATAGLYEKLTTPPAQAAHMERLGYGLAFELELLACLLIATGVIGGPIGLAGAYTATAVRDRRGADWPYVRTALAGSYAAGLTAGAIVFGALLLRR